MTTEIILSEQHGTKRTEITFADKLKYWLMIEDLKVNLIKAGVEERFWRHVSPREFE